MNFTRKTSLQLAFVAVLALGAPLGGSAANSAKRPAVAQLEWVVGLLNSPSPLSTGTLHRHFAPGFLNAVARQRLLAALYPAWSRRPVRVRTIGVRQPTSAVAPLATDGASFRATVMVCPTRPHLITGLLLQPVAARLTSWRAIDGSLARLGTRAALYVGSPDGKPIRAVEASTPLAVGSASSCTSRWIRAGSVSM